MKNDIGGIIEYAPRAAGFTLGRWSVYPDSDRLAHDGVELKLTPLTMKVLNHLALRAGEVVTHEELLAEYWRGAISSPNALHKCVAELRRALTTGGDPTIYVETVRKHGYRLAAPVRRSPLDGTPTRHEEPHRTDARNAHLITADRRSALLATADLPGRDPAETAFLDAIERAVLARAGQQPNVSIRSTTLPVDDAGDTAAASRLEADYAVHVDAQVDGDRLRASLVVTPMAPGLPSHQQQFESAAADRLGLVDEVMAAGATVLSVLLDDRHLEGMRRWGTRNAHAYLCAVEGEPLHRSQYSDVMWRAVELFERALTHDPSFEGAYEMLADLFHDLGMLSRGNAEREQIRQRLLNLFQRARHHLKEAEVCHYVEQQLRFMSAANPFDADALWSREIRSDPGNVHALRRYADLLVGAQLIDESEAYLKRAIELAPDQARDWLEMDEVVLAGARGQFEIQVVLMKRSLERFPDYSLTMCGLVRVLARLERFAEAEMYLHRLEKTDVAWGYFARLQLMALRGDIPPGSNALAHAFADPLANPTSQGVISFMLGDIDSGIRYWRQIDPGYLPLLWQMNTAQEWFWAPGVRENAGYQALLDELGFGPRWRSYMRDSIVELAPVTGIALTTPA